MVSHGEAAGFPLRYHQHRCSIATSSYLKHPPPTEDDTAFVNAYHLLRILFSWFPLIIFSPLLTMCTLCFLLQWLNEEKVIQRLVDMVQSSQDEDVSDC